jgi:hypothetical protein
MLAPHSHAIQQSAARSDTRTSPSNRRVDGIAIADLAPEHEVQAVDGVAKDGDQVVHIRCLVRRPIAGSSALPGGTLIGDEHIGRRLGRTRTGQLSRVEAVPDIGSISAGVWTVGGSSG